jgi:hypothetical protein
LKLFESDKVFAFLDRDTSDAGKRNRIVGNNTHRMAETQRLDIEESEDFVAHATRSKIWID